MTTMILSATLVAQYFATDGTPLAGGQLFCYAGGTSSTKQSCFTDSTGGVALPNPIVLNARGEIAASATGTATGLWMDPTLSYKFVLAPSTDSDPPTNPIWTIDNVVSPEAAVLADLAAFKATIASISIGGIVPYGGASAPSGWLFCTGAAISRTTYAALFGIIGTAFGVGDASTTFNLPDLRGRAIFGKDDMGGSAANRITSIAGITGTTLGAAGGSQLAATHTHVLTDPGHTHTLTDPGHFHAIQTQSRGSSTPNGVPDSDAGAVGPDGDTRNHTTGITITSSVTSVTIASSGAGSSQNMPPAQICNYLIYAAV